MRFEKTIDLGSEVLINNQYKCVKYDEEMKNKWRAYFKPSGWVNFGNSCELNEYNNPKAYRLASHAKEACKRHYEKFGDNPNQWDRV